MGRSGQPTPEERYLDKKRASLAELESLLAERELELHTLRGGVSAFEAQYEAVIGVKFTELDELRVQIAERSPPKPEPTEAPAPPAAPRPATRSRPRPGP